MRSNQKLQRTRETASKRNTRRQRAARQKRRLQFELLEPRIVLACGDPITNLASIVGIVADDVAGDGIDPADPGLSGVQMYLYKDGGNEIYESGNGIAGGDDAYISDTTTDAVGFYRFDGLAKGRYFVEQTQAVGYFPAGQVETQSVTADDVNGKEGVLIDPFADPLAPPQRNWQAGGRCADCRGRSEFF